MGLRALRALGDLRGLRVLLAPEGTRGDVQPLVALGQELADRGCRVVACAPPDARALVERHGLGFEPLEMDVRAYLEAQAAVITGSRLGSGLAMQRAALHYFRQALDQQFRVLGRVARAHGAGLIVGGGVQLGAPSVAESLGVPYRYVAYCPVLFPSGGHPPFMVEREIRSPRLNRLLWRGFLGAYGALLRRPINARRAPLGLPPVRDAYAYLRGDAPLLATDPELAPLPRDCPFPVVPVGFLHPRAEAAAAGPPGARVEGDVLPAKLEAFLEAGPPPVYLGFGSMPDPDPAATTRTLVEAVTAAGLRALVSEGWARLGTAAGGVALPEGVLTIGPVSHTALFPRVAAVVHHAGAGTTTTAARAGVPQVAVPHVLDQFYWGRRVRDLGLGPPPLPRRRLTAARLAALLAETVGNEVLAERAADVGRRMRARTPSAVAALLPEAMADVMADPADAGHPEGSGERRPA